MRELIELPIALWFGTYFLHQTLNIPFRLKVLFNIKISKEIKPLDCYPCFSFWIALAISLNPITAMLVYFMATIIDRK